MGNSLIYFIVTDFCNKLNYKRGTAIINKTKCLTMLNF